MIVSIASSAIPLPEHILTFSLVVFRVGSAMAFLPAFGEQVVPARVKIAATLGFSSILAPLIWTDITASTTEQHWVALIGPEVVAGLLIGFLFRAMVFSLQIAGMIAAQSTSLSQFFGGGLGADPQPAFSTLFVVSGLYVATILGLHIRILEIAAYSYEVFPTGNWPNPAASAEWVTYKISYIFGLSFSLAGPFVLASIIYNLGLGAINKAMPQLMVALVGAPAISFGGLLLLFVTCPIILTIWGKAFVDITDPIKAGL